MADDWTVVPKGKRNAAKRRYGNHKQKTHQQQHGPDEPEARVDPEAVADQLISCCQHLTRSQFFQHFQSIFWDSRRNGNDSDNDDDDDKADNRDVEIVCYGIGTFAQPTRRRNNNNSTTTVNMNFSGPLWQLALALELQKTVLHQQQNQSADTIIKTVYYDPLVTEIETNILQDHYDMTVLSENERGIRCSSSSSSSSNCDTTNREDDAAANSNDSSTKTTTTVFFMPHCPKGLYENVLWANWNALCKNPGAICIVGNSLVTYVERDTTTSNSNTTDKSCLQLIQPFLQERLVSYTKRDVRDMPGYFEAAFNDTYVTTFVAKPQQEQDGGNDNDSNTWPNRPLQPSENGQNEVL